MEEAFSLILREEIQIVGCGRTDAGVHAQQYYFHFDTKQEFGPEMMHRFNKYLPKDIALHAAFHVADNANARYDAVHRTYKYYIRFKKDALSPDLSLWYPYGDALDIESMRSIGALLTKYEAFKTFCKEGSDAKHYLCRDIKAKLEVTGSGMTFTISANRFLRGMVRLIVGACLQVGRGILSIEEVKTALDQQTPLPRADSAPAQGLHLVGVEYPTDLLSSPILTHQDTN
jgi:tRNA pseudouridine38-40 synthase